MGMPNMTANSEEIIEAIKSGRDLSLAEQAKLVDILQEKSKGLRTDSMSNTIVRDARYAILELQRLHYMIFTSVPDISEGFLYGIELQMERLRTAVNYDAATDPAPCQMRW